MNSGSLMRAFFDQKGSSILAVEHENPSTHHSDQRATAFERIQTSMLNARKRVTKAQAADHFSARPGNRTSIACTLLSMICKCVFTDSGNSDCRLIEYILKTKLNDEAPMRNPDRGSKTCVYGMQ